MTWKDVVSKDLAFIIPDSLLIHLETWVSSAAGREVSGVGIMEASPEEKTFTLKKCWLMAAGSVAYTEIPGEQMVKIIKDGVRPDQIKVWWHRHPVGNGIPGPHNWSGTDNHTIREEPFGIDPSMVGWLLSIVRTPRGWVARYDNHERKETTHMEVKGKVSSEQYMAAANLIERHVQAELRANMAAAPNGAQRTSLPKKQARAYRKPPQEPDEVFDQLGLGGFGGKGIRTTPSGQSYDPPDNEKPHPIPGGIEQALQEVGWDRKTYLAVKNALKFELPEFVAFDYSVTLLDMLKTGCISQSELDNVLKHIQERVDAGDPGYIKLIANWELTDL